MDEIVRSVVIDVLIDTDEMVAIMSIEYYRLRKNECKIVFFFVYRK